MRTLKRFNQDERGATAVIFSLSLLPVMGLMGAAVDYSRATSARSQLQSAVDAAALQLTREAPKLTDAQLTTRGQDIIKSLVKAHAKQFTTDTIVVTRGEKTLKINAKAHVDTAIMKVMGYDKLDIGTSSEAAWGNKTIELALVLDNTGSMASSNKMTELKKASLSLLSTLNQAAPDNDTIKVSVVPFDSHVRVNPNTYRNAGWVSYGLNGVTSSSWRGNIADRAQPYDVGATPADKLKTASLYPADSRTDQNLAEIRPLTSIVSGYSDLKSTINAMKPMGCTNVTIGTSWGLATLTDSGPFGLAKPAGTKNLEKIMIVLTDGENTQNRWVDDCNGYGNPKLIDDRTKLACQNAKSAGVRLYTVRVIEGNKTLLRDCASKDANGQPMYYEVKSASELGSVFQAIANEILSTRLTM